MLSLQNLTRHLGQKNTIVTFDQAIYKLAKEIQWKRPEQFEDMVVRMGGFHIMLNYLGTIGKMVADAGVHELLVDAGLYSDATTGSILKGKQYKRAIRAHKLLREALGVCEWKTFVDSEFAEGEVVTNLQELASSVAKCCQEGSLHTKEVFGEMTQAVSLLQDSLAKFREKMQAQSELATFWLNYMDSVDLMLTFIRSEHSQNWDQHLSCVTEMAKYFHAYDRQNYSRWLTVYIADMRNLEKDAPEVQKEFLDGNFGVQRSSRPFCSVWTDLALEQSVNRDVKCSGGLLGITRKEAARDRWFLTTHVNSIISSSLAQIETPNRSCDLTHGEDSTARTSTDYRDICKLVTKLESTIKNPFTVDDAPPVPLSNICTGSKPSAQSTNRIL